MKVDIWSDIICPFCFIGKRRLESVAKEMGVNLDVHWHSFELDPNAPKVYTEGLLGLIAKKYGMTERQAEQSQNQIAQVAQEEGIEFNWRVAKPGNSFDAHRIIHYADTLGLSNQTEEEFFLAYMTNGEAIGEYDTLITVSKRIGLDLNKVDEILKGTLFADQVRNDEAVARKQLNVTGVPFFVFDNQFAVSGAQPRHIFKEVMAKALSLSQEPVNTAGGMVCENGVCSIPTKN